MALKSQHSEVRREILAVLLRLSERYPGLRIAQIIGNAVPTNDLYYIEDSDLFRYLLQYERMSYQNDNDTAR